MFRFFCFLKILGIFIDVCVRIHTHIKQKYNKANRLVPCSKSSFKFKFELNLSRRNGLARQNMLPMVSVVGGLPKKSKENETAIVKTLLVELLQYLQKWKYVSKHSFSLSYLNYCFCFCFSFILTFIYWLWPVLGSLK